MSIGKNIKLLREKYRLSQKDLALIAGVSDKAVSTWENGLKEPRMGAIQRIADHFGLKKSNLIEDDGMLSVIDTPIKFPDNISDDERHILLMYRRLSQQNKDAFKSYLEFLSKKDNGRQSVALVAENQKDYNKK